MLPVAEYVDKTVAREIPHVSGIELVIQPRAAVVPQHQLEKPWAMRDEMLAFRVKSPAAKVAETAVIRSVHESGLSGKSRRNILVHRIEFQPTGTALSKYLVGRTGLMCAVAELGFAGHCLGIHLPVLAESHLPVDSPYSVES